MNLGQLAAPFAADDIEWRIGQAGLKNDQVWARCLAYITSRAVMQRLDDVCGPENWRNEFRHEANGAVLCGISIKWGDEWITKWDGAENTDVEGVKGGLSSAMKRTAVQWGIGRYLYDLPDGFAKVSERGTHWAPANEKKKIPAFKWDPPALPKWALPDGGNGEGAKALAPARAVAAPEPSAEPETKKPADMKMPPWAPNITTRGKRLGDCSVVDLNATAAFCKKPENRDKPGAVALLKAVQLVCTDKALGPAMTHEADAPFAAEEMPAAAAR